MLMVVFLYVMVDLVLLIVGVVLLEFLSVEW